MYPVELSCRIRRRGDSDAQYQAFDRLLYSLRMNGQVLGRELVAFERKTAFAANVLLPERNALDPTNNNSYVDERLERLAKAGLGKMKVRDQGDIDDDITCTCGRRRELVIYADYTYFHSPLKCLSCFDPVPLYRIPQTGVDEYVDIITWASDYEGCHRLYMNDVGVDRFVTRQMYSLDSALTKRGLEVCQRIRELTGRKTYYFLRKLGGTNMKREKGRRCPSCGGEWLLKKRRHCFDFKCSKCCLLSSIGTGVY